MSQFFAYSAKGLHDKVLALFRSFNLPKDATVLDVGCGNGALLNEFHKLGYSNLTGCDGYLGNEEMKEFAQYSKFDFNTGDFSDIQSGADLVTMVEVIEHVEYPYLVCRKIHSVLKSGGRLLITTPNVQTLVSRLLFLFEGNLFSFRKCDMRFDGFPWHVSPIFPYIMEEVLKNEFVMESVTYGDFIVPFFWIPLPFRNKWFGNNVIIVLKKI